MDSKEISGTVSQLRSMALDATCEATQDKAREFKAYIDATPTPFHLVSETAARLNEAGFVEVPEHARWNLARGGKYYYSRNKSTIVAFCVGGKFEPGVGGFKIVGAHTDSPVLKVKPTSKRSAHGYLQVGAECYGGGLWHTWFDRELTVAGCVVVEEKSEDGEPATYSRRLVKVDRPILRIPNLCIHLQTGTERKSFTVNKENHLQPIMAMLNATKGGDEEEGSEDNDACDDRHSPMLLRILAEELKCSVRAIKDFELSLCDTQASQIWGGTREFFSSPRLDNQIHCFTSMDALISYSQASELLSKDTDVSCIALFDHEEVGSQSTCGAGGPVMLEFLHRVVEVFSTSSSSAVGELQKMSIRKSYMISADVAHSIHPCYPNKHEKNHSPLLNSGTVIKTNDNQRYATNAETGFLLRELTKRGGFKVQEFVVRNDCPCGTTIGPIVAGNTGVRTIDVGVPSLSMHSIRETIGVADIPNSIGIFLVFFSSFRALDDVCSF